MQGASRESLRAASDRLSALLAQGGTEAASIGGEFFDVTDLLDAQPALRSALTDPSRSGDDKAALIRSLLSGKLSTLVVEFAEGTVQSRWSNGRDMGDAFELLGAEAVLAAAQQNGQLDGLEDEIFRFSRVVVANPALRAALSDRALPAERKGQVIDSLLQGKASAETTQLISRVVTRPRGRSLEVGLDTLAELAAQRRRRLVATVTAAVLLTQAQRERLAAILTAQFGHDVHLNVVVDPGVVGGLRVSLGDEVIDGSLITRLDDARRRIAG